MRRGGRLGEVEGGGGAGEEESKSCRSKSSSVIIFPCGGVEFEGEA